MICGIFVGGLGRRMGGVAKGLLPIDGEPIVVRTARIARALGHEVVLVGDAAPYEALAIPSIADDPEGIGPLGGLHALLGRGDALVIACDMPHILPADLEALVGFPTDCDVVAARRADDAPWEALFSRWSSRSRKAVKDGIEGGVRSFQRILAGLDVRRIELPARSLRDWDQPSDLEINDT